MLLDCYTEFSSLYSHSFVIKSIFFELKAVLGELTDFFYISKFIDNETPLRRRIQSNLSYLNVVSQL